MKKTIKHAVLGCAALIASGCTNEKVLESKPLLFGQAITFGLSGGTAPQNGNTPEFVVGYKQLNVAVVPTVLGPIDLDKTQLTPDQMKGLKIRGQTRKNDGKDGIQDALSTFGSFDASGESGSVELGTFFATGVAASRLAEGFKEKIQKKQQNGGDAGDNNGDGG